MIAMLPVRLGGTILLLGLLAWYLQELEQFAPARAVLQKKSVTAAELGTGKLQSLLQRRDLLRAEAISDNKLDVALKAQRRGPRYFARTGDLAARRLRRREHRRLVRASAAIRAARLPVVSLVVRPSDLLDKELGILTHPRERGRDWERWAHFIYLRDRNPVFDSDIGIRIHGDHSRLHAYPSFRFYFRSNYGTERTPPNLFFSQSNGPARKLVLHNDFRYQKDRFLSPLGYDIAAHMDCVVPKTEPVEVFFNGIRLENLYFLTEHLSEDFVRAWLGHDDFKFMRCKADGTSADSLRPRFYLDALRWGRSAPAPLTVEQVARKVDVESMLTWIVAVTFCGNHDCFQGLVVLNERDGKLTFVTWDLDQSFQILFAGEILRLRKALRNGEHFKERTFEILDNWQFLRSVLFRRLMDEDPSFRRLLAERALRALNHQLTQEFFESRIEHYREIGERFGLEDVSCLDRYHRFLQRRPVFYRQELQRLVDLGPFRKCVVELPPGVSMLIDGFPHQRTYRGYYVNGSKLSLKWSDPREARRHTWSVSNDKYVATDTELTLTVTDDVNVVVNRAAERPAKL